MIVRARLDWFCLNLEPDGWPCPHSPDWPRHVPEIVAQASGSPDLIFIQGARRFNTDGDELLLAVEQQLGRTCLRTYRGFLTVSPYSDRQQVVYVNSERIEPVHYWHGDDQYELPDRYGFIEVIVDRDVQHPVLLRSIDIGHPGDDNPRMAEARRIVTAAAGKRAVIAGSFTRSVLASLLANGWHNQLHTDADPSAGTSLHRGSANGPHLYHCLTTPRRAIVAQAERVDTSNTSCSDQFALSGVITIFDEEDAR